MVDVSPKEIVQREAVAVGVIQLKKETVDTIKDGKIKKGDPLSAAEIASILAVKKTHEIIPLCHQIPITSANAEFELKNKSIIAKCHVKADYKTGVEMEALTGLTAALLTIWDMVKYLEKDEKGQYPYTSIKDIRLLEKKKWHVNACGIKS